MRIAALAFAAAAVIISGCRDTSGIRGYWSSHTPDITDYAAAEEEFADFAQLALQAPEADAFAAVDMLLNKARKDEVTYLVYTDLIARAFATISSPCYSCAIFTHAADKILRQDLLSDFAAEEYSLRREFCLHNRVGDRAEIPLMNDGVQAEIPFETRTLFLVVDQDCPSCRESMRHFTSAKWDSTARVALCYGVGPLPNEGIWQCRRISPDQGIIDTRQAPFFFVTAPGGTVEITYTSVYNEQYL